jgi:hypothetical protein
MIGMNRKKVPVKVELKTKRPMEREECQKCPKAPR